MIPFYPQLHRTLSKTPSVYQTGGGEVQPSSSLVSIDFKLLVTFWRLLWTLCQQYQTSTDEIQQVESSPCFTLGPSDDGKVCYTRWRVHDHICCPSDKPVCLSDTWARENKCASLSGLYRHDEAPLWPLSDTCQPFNLHSLKWFKTRYNTDELADCWALSSALFRDISEQGLKCFPLDVTQSQQEKDLSLAEEKHDWMLNL